MGVRTAHQVEPKAQLVVTSSGQDGDNLNDLGEESEALDAMRLGNDAEPSELKGLSTESDVLSAPRMVDGSGGAVEGSLGGLQQAVLLCWAQQVKKGTSADELQVCVCCAVLCADNVSQAKGLSRLHANIAFALFVLLYEEKLGFLGCRCMCHCSP